MMELWLAYDGSNGNFNPLTAIFEKLKTIYYIICLSIDSLVYLNLGEIICTFNKRNLRNSWVNRWRTWRVDAWLAGESSAHKELTLYTQKTHRWLFNDATCCIELLLYCVSFYVWKNVWVQIFEITSANSYSRVNIDKCKNSLTCKWCKI